MRKITSPWLVIGSLVLYGGSAIAADEALLERIRALEAQVASLTAQVNQIELVDQQKKEVVQALVREMLADADMRSSLIQDSVVAGHDGRGFFLSSGDGNYLLRVSGMIQARHVYNHQRDSNDADDASGFELTRIRLGFGGHVVDPSWQYFIWTGHAANGGALLLDAWVRKQISENWSVTVGQFKVPLWREWLISETRLPAVERSLVHTYFGGGYTQGVQLGYQDARFRAMLSYNDGLDARSVTWDAVHTDYAFGGRGEWLISGTWDQFADQQGWPGSELAMMLGGGVHYQHARAAGASLRTSTLRWTADLSMKWDRVSLFAAVVSNHVSADERMNQYGALAQAGWFITDRLELFGRYEWGDLDNALDEKLSITTMGANYYVHRHQVKISADVGYSFRPVTAGWTGGGSSAGWRVNEQGKDGQIVVRTQVQLLF